MADPSTSSLTGVQIEHVINAATKNRPWHLLDISVSRSSILVRATCANGQVEFGEWGLEIRGNVMFAHATIDETLYQEALPDGVTVRFDRILAGLEAWGKAINAVELKRLLAQISGTEHLAPESIMNPADYSLLGGKHIW